MNFFVFKDKLDKCLYSFFNVVSSIVYILSVKKKRIIRKNKRFKDIHKNERCFILGCGPSLKYLSVSQSSKLTNEIVFGVNDLYATDFLKNIAPQYYFMVDNAYWGDEIKSVLAADDFYKNKGTLFFSSLKAKSIFNKYPQLNDVIYLYAKLYPNDFIQCDMSKNQTVSINVVTSCIMSAIYMGFSEIYLLGCDYSAFAAPLDEHCYDKEDKNEVIYKKNNLEFYLKYYAITTKVHYLVRKYADQKGVKIVNLTPGSLLDAYTKNDIDLVL